MVNHNRDPLVETYLNSFCFPVVIFLPDVFLSTIHILVEREDERHDVSEYDISINSL